MFIYLCGQVCAYANACHAVFPEPTVRAELMEQIPNIAMFLHESRPNFPAAFSRYLVPIVVLYLTDPNNQVGFYSANNLLKAALRIGSFLIVCLCFLCIRFLFLSTLSLDRSITYLFVFLQVRKTSQAALLVLLEQGLICKADMETKVCPVLLELTEPSSDDDYKTEAVAVRTVSPLSLRSPRT